MDVFFWEYLQLLLRSLHVVTAIAWIGASFYFVWLDNHLRKPTAKDVQARGVDGELWAVHGGGFYNPQKYMVAPAELPQDLHWFYWESYSTWLSGFGLFVVMYLMNPKALLIDPNVYPLTESGAIVLALSVLLVAWILYHGLCRLFENREKLLLLFIVLLVVSISFFIHCFFSGRASYLLTGAAMATIMTANVFFVIIPGQRKVIQLMRDKAVVDPIYGKRGKQRSVHNTYFTLPVVFAMLSNHFSILTGHSNRWVVLILMLAAAVIIRQIFVLRHKGATSYPLIALSTSILLGVFLLIVPRPFTVSAITVIPEVTAYDVIKSRCTQCHAANPTLFPDAPKGLILESKADIDLHRANIYTQVVLNRAMPVGNITEMTEGERVVIKKWFESAE